MEYVRLGSAGLKVSRLALGCMSFGSREREAFRWTLSEDESRPFFRRALEAGINLFDTADAQIHRFDEDTPVEETLEALDDVVRAGKALYIGASTMYAWQFARMLGMSARRGWPRFVSMQLQWSPVYREEEREMVPLCSRTARRHRRKA